MVETWRRLVFRVEPDSEPLTAALWELGTLGLELPDDGSVVAYFEDRSRYAGIDWRDHGAWLDSDEALAAEDWMAPYRAASRPLPIGERLVVDPREPEESEREAANWPGRRLLRLPARTAFGTGSHPSTRLVLELMETLDLERKTVLDVGFGSGILSFAALELGAASVVGVEIDVASALVAGENRRLNGARPRWLAGAVGALAAPAAFDLALVNVLPERVRRELGAIRRLLAPGGAAVFSGITRERADAAATSLTRSGFRVVGRRDGGDWTALTLGTGPCEERPAGRDRS